MGRMSRRSPRGMATDECSALYPLQTVEVAPFLSLLYYTVASQLLHACTDVA